jgi:hypothetical protein
MKDPHQPPETARIVATHPETQGPFVVVNRDDFDPAAMRLYEEAAPKPEKTGKAKND